jgi:hypothetical protein
MDNQLLFLCKCLSPEHQIIMQWDNDDKLVYVSFHFQNHSIFQRIKEAIKHIFGYTSKYGDWDELILNPSDADKLQTVVNYLKDEKDTSSN